MSEFIIRVLKWLAALVTAYFILFALLFLVLIGIGIAMQPVPEPMEDGTILTLDLSMHVTEQPSSGNTAAVIRDALAGELGKSHSLRQVMEAIDDASNDPKVHGLLLTGNIITGGYGSSFASLRELRQAIISFGKKKPVWAHVRSDRLRDYYLKSAASRIISDPYAMIDFRGLAVERMYLGDAFERIGIDFQVEAFEEFKTAWESFQEGSMSEPEEEQLSTLLNDIWNVLVEDISATREVDVESLNGLASRNLLLYGEEIIEGGLADVSLTEDRFRFEMVSEVGYGPEGKTFRQYAFPKYISRINAPANPLEMMGGGNQVAVLHIEGILMDGESADGFAGSDTINGHLRDVREDSSVKAVVLRINSPGGSNDASHRVVREIALTREEKPVVVSMGGVAASGGYMVAAPGDHIFVQPTTITGSIGVVSMLPNIEKLAEKLSIQFEGVETHPYAGSFTLGRAKTEDEMHQIRALGARAYDEFLQMVADNRGMTVREVRSLAKGRVWSGKAAVEIGLADELGGLMHAVRRAADLAGIGDDYRIKELPRALTFEEQLQEMFSASASTSEYGLGSLVGDMEAQIRQLQAFNDPHGQYLILPYSLNIR